MKQIHRTVCAGLALLLCAAAAAQENRLTPEEKKAGWRLLFDGKTMNGWDDPARKTPPGNAWSVDDGWLKATRRARITEDLFTTDRFRNFELVFDWRISPAGNSGVKYRIQDHLFVDTSNPQMFEQMVQRSFEHRDNTRQSHGQDYVVGFEYQVIDNRKSGDAVRGGALHQAGALYDMVPPTTDATKPVGEVNHSRIVLNGNHVEHWMNGVKVVDANLSSPEVKAHIAKRWGEGSAVYKLLAEQPHKDCPISLQNHGDEAWFRNIKIRPLP